jgi:hypothetical protein
MEREKEIIKMLYELLEETGQWTKEEAEAYINARIE